MPQRWPNDVWVGCGLKKERLKTSDIFLSSVADDGGGGMSDGHGDDRGDNSNRYSYDNSHHYQFLPAGLLIMFFVFCNADETLTKEQSNICRLDWRCYE